MIELKEIESFAFEFCSSYPKVRAGFILLRGPDNAPDPSTCTQRWLYNSPHLCFHRLQYRAMWCLLSVSLRLVSHTIICTQYIYTHRTVYIHIHIYLWK